MFCMCTYLVHRRLYHIGLAGISAISHLWPIYATLHIACNVFWNFLWLFSVHDLMIRVVDCWSLSSCSACAMMNCCSLEHSLLLQSMITNLTWLCIAGEFCLHCTLLLKSSKSFMMINLTELATLYILFRVRVERKQHVGRVVRGHKGVESGEGVIPLPEKIFWISSKIAGFYAFLLKKHYFYDPKNRYCG